ncbi:MAG: hypothetical protein U5J96_05000 [Ignavibacteriaceae bacterium]|nr:hypothetical protein [Ignavibacteriaceae bacterium]
MLTINSSDYNNYKELKAPSTYDFITYGEEGSTFDPETNTAIRWKGPHKHEIDNPDLM